MSELGEEWGAASVVSWAWLWALLLPFQDKLHLSPQLFPDKKPSGTQRPGAGIFLQYTKVVESH
jgi:hypothetical protein